MKEKAGWLHISSGSNEKRYYCYLRNHVLEAAVEPFGKIKRRIDLELYTCTAWSKLDEGTLAYLSYAPAAAVALHRPTSMVVAPLNATASQLKKKSCVLRASSADDAGAWLEAIVSWDVSAVFKSGSKRASYIVERDLVSPRSRGVGAAGHCGWLMLQSKKYFFRIDADTFTLFWLAKESDESSMPSRASGLVQGSVPLRDCSVLQLDETTFELVTVAGTKFVLRSYLASECTEWMEALQLSFEQLGVDEQDARPAVADSMRGELMLLTNSSNAFGKKRFVLLRGSTLSWYASESDVTPDGSISLLACGISESNNCFSITTKSGKTFEWMAASQSEARDWLKKLRAAIHTGHARYSSRGLHRQSSSLDFKTWVIRKGKRRLFVLRNNTILWYEREQGSDAPQNCVESVALNECSSARVDDKDPDAVLIERREAKAEALRFVCEDSARVAPLVNAVNGVIVRIAAAAVDDPSLSAVAMKNALNKKASSRGSGALPSADALAALPGAAADGVVHRGAGKRNGKQRFFVLLKRHLRFYANESAYRNGKTAKASVRLEDCIVEESATFEKDAALLLVQPTGKQLTLAFPSKPDAHLWLKHLRTTIADADSVLQPNRVFGVPLAHVAVPDEETPGAVVLPHVLLEPMQFIEKYASSVPGLFRESGNQSDILRYRRQLNRGVAVKFPKSIDAHIVAGVWKMWLRELPEPLVPYAHYEKFMALDANADDCVALVDELPEPNRTVLTRILDFLYQFSRAEDKHNMSISNLAIVFGPLFLRRGDDDQLQQLRESPQVMSVARSLIRQRAMRQGASQRDVFGADYTSDVDVNVDALSHAASERDNSLSTKSGGFAESGKMGVRGSLLLTAATIVPFTALDAFASVDSADLEVAVTRRIDELARVTDADDPGRAELAALQALVKFDTLVESK